MSKRIFDVFFSLFGLIILSPLFIIVSIIILFGSKGPIFFRQIRVGKNGKLFLIHKFRTMKVDSETTGKLTIGVDKRITREGRLLRKLKIDELPQLIDVLFGKMSLVGPRPEVPEFIECYPPKIRAAILTVRPGITDKASIVMVDENEILSKYTDPRKAYIEIILPLKQKHYLEYVNNHSIYGDIMIILQTITKIFSR